LPIYEYQCKKCLGSWEDIFKLDDSDLPESQPCKFCGTLGEVGKLITGTTIVSGVNLAAKVPAGFKEVLQKIKAAHKHHSIDGELS